MEIIARIRYDKKNRQIVYSAELIANRVPLYEPNVNIREQIDMLDMAHESIKTAIEDLNDRLQMLVLEGDQ